MAKRRSSKKKSKKKTEKVPKKEIEAPLPTLKGNEIFSNCLSWYGIFLLVIGIIWLLDDIGIMSVDISLWPLVFMVTGATLVYKKINKHLED